jgi:hypothetical protein
MVKPVDAEALEKLLAGVKPLQASARAQKKRDKG